MPASPTSNVKLNLQGRASFFDYATSRVAHLNSPLERCDRRFRELSKIAFISRKFLRRSIYSRKLVLKLGLFNQDGGIPLILLDAHSTNGASFLDIPLSIFELRTLLDLSFVLVAEFRAVPPVLWQRPLYGRKDLLFDPDVMRFYHYVNKKTLHDSHYGSQKIPAYPDVHPGRTRTVPYFYSRIFELFPADICETYVHLPRLFLHTEFTSCQNASLKVIAFDTDHLDPSTSRVLMSIDEDPEAELPIQHIFRSDRYTTDVNFCEGLAFGTCEEYNDPKTGIESKYAFKLSDQKLRLLIMIKCTSHGRSLIDHAIQTGRLYLSILGELPSLKAFDIALLINVDRQAFVRGQPFAFCDTHAAKIYDKSLTTAQSIADLKAERPDLRWFTDMCAPHSTYRAFAYEFHPMNRCLYLVDVCPTYAPREPEFI